MVSKKEKVYKMQTITITEDINGLNEFQKLVQEASYVESGESVIVSKNSLEVLITKQSNILVAEKELLISMCDDVKNTQLWENKLIAAEQVEHIARTLQMLGLSFAQMTNIGSNHSLDKSENLIENIVQNYQLCIEDIFRELLTENNNDDKSDDFLDKIVLVSSTHDNHYSIGINNIPISFNKLATDGVLSVYEVSAVVGEEEDGIYSLYGEEIQYSISSREEEDLFLLNAMRIASKKLLKEMGE